MGRNSGTVSIKALIKVLKVGAVKVMIVTDVVASPKEMLWRFLVFQLCVMTTDHSSDWLPPFQAFARLSCAEHTDLF